MPCHQHVFKQVAYLLFSLIPHIAHGKVRFDSIKFSLYCLTFVFVTCNHDCFLNTCIPIESKNSCSPCVDDIIWYYYCIISELQQNVWTMQNKLFADISSSRNVLRLPKLDSAVWDFPFWMDRYVFNGQCAE